MTSKKTKRAGSRQPKRLHFPSDEPLHPWLPVLLDAYFMADRGIAEAVRLATGKGRKLACARGCSHCCTTHQTIPVYPLELVGLSWYVTEKMRGSERNVLKEQLRDYQENGPCPFLIEGACSVHPMRPVACRQFNVFDRPCDEGEDPYYTRREDVLTPIKKYVNHAFFIMLPFYGLTDASERWKVIESGAVHQIVKLMQACNWASLADKMEEFEKRVVL